MRTPVFSATWPAGSSDNWRCNSPHLLLCHRAVKFLGGGPDFYGGLGTASFSGTVQITGGTGTGYLEILPSSILATQITGGAFNVNGQPVLHSSAGYFPWTQVPFTFGDSVSYNLSVWST
jgi:hypothetical protein